SALDALPPGGVIVLENLRFYAEEEKNDDDFAKKLAAPFEVFIMDAFSAAHRAHASTRAITDHLKSFAGPLLIREIDMLGETRDNPKHPFILILGGAKVSDKISVIENLMDKVDAILIGGGMAFTFLKAQGFEIGHSLCESEKLDFAREMLSRSKEKGVKILLPTDAVVANEVSVEASSRVVSVDAIPSDMMGLDVGPATSRNFCKALNGARTVLWNGPMGVFEMAPFAEGTKIVAEELVKITKGGAMTVIGGGDSAAAIAKFGLEKEVTHVSTGGGASLEFFEGKTLPGVEPFVL
ncbi:MAG: phosphoglycerate kinase, partial [Synergistaceae bacterium]|nr:phosphoglycerate kinase [Synergistaceae bacterium]